MNISSIFLQKLNSCVLVLICVLLIIVVNKMSNTHEELNDIYIKLRNIEFGTHIDKEQYTEILERLDSIKSNTDYSYYKLSDINDALVDVNSTLNDIEANTDRRR